MDVKQRIENAKANIERGNRAKATAEAQLQMANSQIEEITQKFEELGVTPETAAEEIAKLEAKINEDLDRVEGMIPKV